MGSPRMTRGAAQASIPSSSQSSPASKTDSAGARANSRACAETSGRSSRAPNAASDANHVASRSASSCRGEHLVATAIAPDDKDSAIGQERGGVTLAGLGERPGRAERAWLVRRRTRCVGPLHEEKCSEQGSTDDDDEGSPGGCAEVGDSSGRPHASPRMAERPPSPATTGIVCRRVSDLAGEGQRVHIDGEALRVPTHGVGESRRRTAACAARRALRELQCAHGVERAAAVILAQHRLLRPVTRPAGRTLLRSHRVDVPRRRRRRRTRGPCRRVGSWPARRGLPRLQRGSRAGAG